MRNLSRFPIARTGLILGALAAICLGLLGMNTAAADSATTVSVSGVVFYDRDGDGVQEPGESGLAGLRVHDKSGKHSALTDAAGRYALTDLKTTGDLRLETGWFRSQCPPVSDPTATSCPAGPGGFRVDNQFIEYALSATGISHADVGLVPDWPGDGMAEPAAVGGVLPANEVDVAARLTSDPGGCAAGAYAVCRAGDTFTLSAQVYNEGTAPLTGIVARLFVPPGDCATGLSPVAWTVPDGLGPVTFAPATPTCATRYVTATIGGTLIPAGGVRISIRARTATGPGTPGCTVTKTAKTCPRDEPQGRGWLFGIARIDQTGDPDSTFCAAGDMSGCPTGLHDKRRAPDDIDPAGHNVDAALGGTKAYNLVAHLAVRDAGGDAVTVRAWATDRVASGDTNASPAGVVVRTWFPAGTTVLRVPPPHPLISCDGGKVLGGAVAVTCVLGGPVAPYLGSPAADMTVRLPAGGSRRAVVCVAPPAGAAHETAPAAAGCDLGTPPSASDDTARVTLP